MAKNRRHGPVKTMTVLNRDCEKIVNLLKTGYIHLECCVLGEAMVQSHFKIRRPPGSGHEVPVEFPFWTV